MVVVLVLTKGSLACWWLGLPASILRYGWFDIGCRFPLPDVNSVYSLKLENYFMPCLHPKEVKDKHDNNIKLDPIYFSECQSITGPGFGEPAFAI